MVTSHILIVNNSMAQCSNKNRRNVMRRLLAFLNQPFFEQKYIILVKSIRLFCDWAYILNVL